MLQEKPKTISLTDKELESLGIDANVNDLRLARSFVKETSEDSGGCIVYYFAPPKLPDTKTVILSATFNSEVYRKYFQREIIEYPVVLAPYCGKLKQFTYHSLERRNLKEKENQIKEFKEDNIDSKIEAISFKDFDYNNGCNLHFGNAIGVNGLEGKDILIIGTPFKNEKCYNC